MTNEFQILENFLQRFGSEVEGRLLGEPPAAVLRELRALAQGDLAEPERVELMELLGENPQWVRRLAEEVKALRGGRVPGEPETGA